MLTALLVVLSQTVAEPPMSAAQSRARYVDGPRVRFGIGSWSVGGVNGTPMGGVAGVSTHLGLQVDDRLAFYVLAQGSTAAISGGFVGGALVEYSLFSWFSAAAGVGAAGSYLGISGGYIGGPGRGRLDSALSVGAPVRLTFTMGPTVAENLHRHRFFIALDGFVGTTLAANPALTLTGGLSIGYQLM